MRTMLLIPGMIIALKLVAFEHSTFDSVSKPLVEREGLAGNIPLLIGSDTLILVYALTLPEFTVNLQ